MKGNGLIVLITIILVVAGCITSEPDGPGTFTREEAIPENAKKMTSDDDLFPPVSHLDLWESPVIIGDPINTAGAEDSPYITPDGNELYFFFTPDVGRTPQQQVTDGVTGLWYSKKIDEKLWNRGGSS